MVSSYMALVLCLDDDLVIAQMTARAVKFLGHQAIIETDSIQAVTRHVHTGLGAAVVDFNMPHLDGIEVLAAFQQSSPKTRRILLTASPSQIEVTHAVNEGIIQKVLSKPVTLNDFELALAWL